MMETFEQKLRRIQRELGELTTEAVDHPEVMPFEPAFNALALANGELSSALRRHIAHKNGEA